MTITPHEVVKKYGKDGKIAVPKPPENLQKEGKKAWKRVWETAGDLLKDSDFFAVERLCVLIDDEFDLKNELVVLGKTWYKMNKVTLAEHPVSKRLTETRKEMLAVMRECGLTPSSRARIQIETNGFEEIMQALITASGRSTGVSKMEVFD